MNQRIYNEMLNLKAQITPKGQDALVYLISTYNWNPEYLLPDQLTTKCAERIFITTTLDLTPEEDEQQGTIQLLALAYPKDNNAFIKDISSMLLSELDSIGETLAIEDLADDDWEGYLAYLDQIGYLLYVLQKMFQTQDAKNHWMAIRNLYQECLDLINPMNEIQGLEPNILEGSIVENEFTRIYF